MICPKCGTEIPEGKLYCEKCGEEIRMVPEFEPEIEYSIKESLSDVGEMVEEDKTDKEVKKKGNKIFFGTFIAIAALLLVFCIILSVWYYRYHSFSYQIRQAENCFAEGKISEACVYYERALEIEPDNVSLKIALADMYRKVGNEQAFLTNLYDVFEAGNATKEEILVVYKQLISYFIEKEEYASVNELLMDCPDESLRNTYQSYMANPPAFSYSGGNYAEMIALKLTSSTQGTIHYTMDGTMPDENSEVYTTPIFLDTGNYTITAIFVNEYGIKSTAVSENFDIDVIKPVAPEVLTLSGDYSSPQLIEVVEPSEGVVYYTLDGTEPTINSFLYDSPIPMPVGESTFMFVVFSDDGVKSECSIMHYNLVLNTEITPELAINGLVAGLVETGKLRDEYGTPESGEEGRYLYVYQAAVTIEGNDYYLVNEIYEDAASMQNKTGIVYAVNVYNGNCFKVLRGALDEYILEPFQ